MNIERLNLLAKHLCADASNPTGVKFDMGCWMEVDSFTSAPKQSCGTTACAFGLATLIPEFQAQGLNIQKGSITFSPEFSGLTGFSAARLFFDLTMEETYLLFSPDSYPRDRQNGAAAERYVAQRIHRLTGGYTVFQVLTAELNAIRAGG